MNQSMNGLFVIKECQERIMSNQLPSILIQQLLESIPSTPRLLLLLLHFQQTLQNNPSLPSFLPASRQRLHLQMQRLPQHIRLRRHLPRLVIEHLRRAGLPLLRHLLSTLPLVPTRSADFCRYHFRLAQSNTHPLLCSCRAATY